ncbi:MAG: YcxB family protein [Pyrinomonadaceae bacterium]
MQIRDETIIFEIEYDAEELLRPMIFQMKSRSWYRRLIDARSSVVINFVAALAVLYWLDLVSFRSVLLSAAAAVFVSGFAAIPVFEYLSAFATFLEHKYRDRYAHIAKPAYNFNFSPTGIRRQYQDTVDMSEWTDIESAVETEEDILLSHRDRKAYFFPKRMFQDFNELAYFKNFIRDRIGDRAEF